MAASLSILRAMVGTQRWHMLVFTHGTSDIQNVTQRNHTSCDNNSDCLLSSALVCLEFESHCTAEGSGWRDWTASPHGPGADPGPHLCLGLMELEFRRSLCPLSEWKACF